MFTFHLIWSILEVLALILCIVDLTKQINMFELPEGTPVWVCILLWIFWPVGILITLIRYRWAIINYLKSPIQSRD